MRLLWALVLKFSYGWLFIVCRLFPKDYYMSKTSSFRITISFNISSSPHFVLNLNKDAFFWQLTLSDFSLIGYVVFWLGCCTFVSLSRVCAASRRGCWLAWQMKVEGYTHFYRLAGHANRLILWSRDPPWVALSTTRDTFRAEVLEGNRFRNCFQSGWEPSFQR
jgi:hypothetical protein